MKAIQQSALILCALFVFAFPPTVLADGNDMLGPPSIPLENGTDVLAAGTGLINQPGDIDLFIPAGVTIQQVLVYWEGRSGIIGNPLINAPGPTDDIIIDGVMVTGNRIGGPTPFGDHPASTAYRADITALVEAGTITMTAGVNNNYVVSGLNFSFANDGAAIVVIVDDGSGANTIQFYDGIDVVVTESNPSVGVLLAIPVTFTFPPSSVPRNANLINLVGDAREEALRPNALSITIGDAAPMILVDPFFSADSPRWDTLQTSIVIPPGVTSVTVQPLSEDFNEPPNPRTPSSLCWVGSILRIQDELACLGDFVWYDLNGDGLQDMGEPGVPDITVHLYNCADMLLDTQSTGPDGKYLFCDLEPGDYYVVFTNLPPGFKFTTKGPDGSSDSLDSDADTTTGRTECTTLVASETDLTWDAGICCPIMITCPPDITVQCPSPTDPSVTGEPTVVSPCGDAEVTFEDELIPGNCPSNFTIIRTWRAEDPFGFVAICTQTIVSQDTAPPVFVLCPMDQDLGCNPPPDTIPDCNTAISATDLCGMVSLQCTSVTVTNGCERVRTITVVATDECGNQATCEYTVTWIVDVIPPVLVNVPDGGDLGCNPANIPTCDNLNVTATDNCGPVQATCSAITTTNGCVITRTFTFMATDECLNTATAIRAFTWTRDTTPPVFTVCPDDVTLGCIEPDLMPGCDLGEVEATDECGPVVITCVFVDSVVGCRNIRTITYTATDICQNTSTCVKTVTWIDDNQPPNIVCEEDFEVECNTDWVFDIPTATDDCDGTIIEVVSTITNVPAMRCPVVYSVTRTWKATDECGNEAFCSQTATVVDIHPPNIVCEEDFEVECGLDWAFDIPTAVDKCDLNNVLIEVVSTVTNVAAPQCPQLFSVTRVWRATDTCGNAAFCSQTVTIVDLTPPTITCGDDKSAECGTGWAFDVPTAADLCSDVVVEIVSTVTNVAAMQCPEKFSVRRTWSATDTCGNVSFCNQTVTIVDTTPPNITCSDNIIAECGNPNAFLPPTAVDVCDANNVVIEIVGTVTNLANPQCPQLFTATRTWRATDICGNASFCTQTLTVVDTRPPSIFCAEDRIVQCGVPWTFTPPAAADLCGNVTVEIVSTITNAACGNTFSATRTWRATDECGNSALCSQSVLVVDTRPPDLICAADRFVDCGSPWNFNPPSAADICSGADVTVEVVSTVTNALCGTTIAATRTWRATDECGNASVCSQTITVVDRIAPTISCANNRVIECGTPWNFNAPTATDLCDANVTITILSTVTNALCGSTFTATRTWEATDDCGNKSVCSQTIFVVDTVPPVLIGIPTYPQPFLCLADVPAPPTVTAFDSCDPNVTVTMTSVTNGMCPTIITRCWTARDACSNSVTECQFIVVQPRPPVLLTAPTDQVVCPGDDAMFCVQVSSACPVTYQWFKDGVAIPGATAECLQLPGVDMADAGEYCAVVQGECHSLTNCAELIVLTNTVVTVEAPRCIERGSSVQICPTITGTGPFTCVWTRNGGLISSDCCLTINNFNDASAGEYTISVTGFCNTDTETINLCPPLDTASIPITVVSRDLPCLGGPLTLCTVEYDPACVNYQWYKHSPTPGNEIPGGTGACVTTSLDVSPTVFYVVAFDPQDPTCRATNSIPLDCEPDICLTKSANRPTVAPGGLVTYTYVVTNCGQIPLVDVDVVDDNGTPNMTADDFVVATGVSLDVGEVAEFTFTKQAPILLCDSEGLSGLLEVIDLGDRIRAIFYQDPSINNNAYGTSAAQFGWTRSHTFNNLVGSDKAEFEFRNGAGTVVLRAEVDYISSSGSFPSGFGTLGVTGGEGDVEVGSAAHVLAVSTSISENVNKEPFLSNPQYRVNSPALGDPNLALWENQMIYSIDVSNAAFGASGFGSVAITDQHNSPENGAPRPPCELCITNVAEASGVGNTLNGPITVTDIDDAVVCITTNPVPCIDVVKEIACLLPNGECGPFSKQASGIAGDQDVGFCYRITVINCGDDTLTDLRVLDDKLGDLTSMFFSGPSDTLPVGGSVTRIVKMAWGVNTTNTVVASGRRPPPGSPRISDTDSAVALVLRPLLTCDVVVGSPCDLDGNPNDNHVSLPEDNSACVVSLTATICNDGPVPLHNVTITSPVLAAIGCSLPPPFSLGVGECFVYACTGTLRCENAPIVADITVSASADTTDLCAFDFDGEPITHTTSCFGSVTCGEPPCIELEKTVDQPTAAPGSTVTYTYTVTNCGGVPLTNIEVVDDNGTPTLPGDDFVVGVIPSLAAGASTSLQATVTLPVRLCDDQLGFESGLLVTEVLPNGNIQVSFIQDFGVNDNTYGVNSIGWGKKIHTLKNLVGSDKAEFEFKDGQGQVVLRFAQDYISEITPTAQFPSGYRSLGVTGGEGDVEVGSASSVLSWSTSLEENLNKAPFKDNLAQYTVDSPALSDPNSGLWEYRMIYTVVIDQNVFGAAGFGSVMITDQHNSPAKKSVSGPEPCSGCVTNIATATATAAGMTLTATDNAVVCSDEPPPSGECPEKADFWKKNQDAWVTYTPNQTVGSVFAKASLYPDTANKTLAQAIDGKGSSNKEVKELLKEAVAALLNAASPGITYPFNETDIIDGVNMALMSGNKDNLKSLTKLLKDANDPKNCGKASGDNCDTAGKPNVLTLQYTGASCASSMNSQEPGKTSCSGDPLGAGTVRIIASSSSTPPSGSSDRFFDGIVNLNEQFEVEAGDKFGANTYFFVYNGSTLVQTIQIHTSCSAPLRRGESFGSLVLVDYRIDP